MHAHISALAVTWIFLSVLMMGTLWRLSAAHLCSSETEWLQHLGKAMSFQY